MASGTPRRVLLLAVLSVIVWTTGVGCAQTSYSCSDGKCEVSLGGAGATTEIDNNVEVVLVSVEEGEAKLSVAGEAVSCTEGDTAEVSRAEITCDTVQEDEVDLTVLLSAR